MKSRKFATLGLLALLLLACAGCKEINSYDIRGIWSFRNGSMVHFVFTFSGTREAGTLATADPQSGTGTYTVSGEEVVFNFTSAMIGGTSCHFSGSFDSEDKMSGTMEFIAPYPPFEWSEEVEGSRLYN